MQLVFATNNQHKVDEIKAILPKSFSIITLQDAGIDIDIPEPHDSLQANAEEKAKTIYELTGHNCFSEDTGLEVAALNNEPGVLSARYAGEGKSSKDNINKVLMKLDGNEDRQAQFRTVICLLLNGTTHFFDGICNGTIITKEAGYEGFGYDPIFIPHGAAKTFAEMSLQEKNEYSHRRKATDKLVTFLSQLEEKG